MAFGLAAYGATAWVHTVEADGGKRGEVPMFGWAILGTVVALGFMLGLGMVWWL